MADTQSVISDVKLFIERLKKELPEVFSNTSGPAEAAGPASDNRVLYNGNLYEARMYITPDQEEGVAFDGEIFHIYLQSKTADPSALVTQWLRNKAGETLRQKTQQWAEKMGVEYNNITIKDQRTLWASCSGKKNINYSYRIIKMPLAVQDYLIVHELSHLVHMNHGQEYWQLVAQYCPDYNHHRKWLNENKGSIFAEVELMYKEPAETAATQPEQTHSNEPADTTPNPELASLDKEQPRPALENSPQNAAPSHTDAGQAEEGTNRP